MATLTPDRSASVAPAGFVAFDVDPAPYGDAELFERVVPFAAEASWSARPFTRVARVFTEGVPTRHTNRAPLGSLYQARLYPRGTVPDGRPPTETDRPIGRLDLPCLDLEHQESFLTRCRGTRAQITLDVGDTWLGATLATGRDTTRMMLLVGDTQPAEHPTGQGPWPRFGDRLPVTFASSADSARLHRLYAPPRELVPVDEGIDPRLEVHYIAVVWTADGHFDYVWADDGFGGSGVPQAVVTGTREVSAKVTRLVCLDDSFQDDFGISWTGPAGGDSVDVSVFDDSGLFDLAWADSLGGTAYARSTWLWRHMDDGDVVVPDLEFRWRGGAEARTARIIIASGGCSAEVFVPEPAGEGVRSRTYDLRAEGRFADPDGTGYGDVGFYADLTVTVGSG